VHQRRHLTEKFQAQSGRPYPDSKPLYSAKQRFCSPVLKSEQDATFSLRFTNAKMTASRLNLFAALESSSHAKTACALLCLTEQPLHKIVREHWPFHSAAPIYVEATSSYRHRPMRGGESAKSEQCFLAFWPWGRLSSFPSQSEVLPLRNVHSSEINRVEPAGCAAISAAKTFFCSSGLRSAAQQDQH
jgi:hypothetical protein